MPASRQCVRDRLMPFLLAALAAGVIQACEAGTGEPDSNAAGSSSDDAQLTGGAGSDGGRPGGAGGNGGGNAGQAAVGGGGEGVTEGSSGASAGTSPGGAQGSTSGGASGSPGGSSAAGGSAHGGVQNATGGWSGSDGTGNTNGDGGGASSGELCGCTEANALDLRHMTDVVIRFSCCAYDPRCIKIAAHSTVTFKGQFGSHPLTPDRSTGSQSPIESIASGSSATFTFSDPGTFGYYCNLHADEGPFGGMCGAVFVVP